MNINYTSDSKPIIIELNKNSNSNKNNLFLISLLGCFDSVDYYSISQEFYRNIKISNIIHKSDNNNSLIKVYSNQNKIYLTINKIDNKKVNNNASNNSNNTTTNRNNDNADDNNLISISPKSCELIINYNSVESDNYKQYLIINNISKYLIQ